MSIKQLDEHAPLWAIIQRSLDGGRLPQALLFVGPLYSCPQMFAKRLMASLLCQNQKHAPCGDCRSCQFIIKDTHPDVLYIQPEDGLSVIKIDQIRQLQHSVYQTPQCGNRRFIVVNPANTLNESAANALLKILEEPPAHTIFILLARHLSSLPETIISRCQRYVIPWPLDKAFHETIQEDDVYEDLRTLVVDHAMVFNAADSLSKYSLSDVLCFLYKLTADSIKQKLTGRVEKNPFLKVPLVDLFQQIDRISELLISIDKNVTLNQALAIETLLLGYARKSE